MKEITISQESLDAFRSQSECFLAEEEEVQETASIEDIAYENGLEVIETTDQWNGYPSHLRKAIIGLQSFDEAKQLAEQYGLDIEFFERRDGWQLYYRTGNTATEPIRPREEWYKSDDVHFYEHQTYEEFRKWEIDYYLKDFTIPSERRRFIRSQEKIYERVKTLADDEIAVFFGDDYYETISSESMSFYYDTRLTVIGLIKPLD